MIKIERTYTITLLDSNVINYNITSNKPSCITINNASGSFNGTTNNIYVTYYITDINCFKDNTITVIVTNDKGCSNTFTDTLVNECNSLDVNIEQPDANNLSFNAIVTGGKEPYLYNWVYGLPNQFTSNEPNAEFHSQNQLSLSWNHNPANILPPGYKNPQGIKVIVKDANSCITDVTKYYTLTCEPFVSNQSIAAPCFPLNDGDVRKFVITLTNSGCGNLVNNPLVITYAGATRRSLGNNSYEITIPEFSTTSVVLPITVTNDKNVPSNTFNVTVTKLGTCKIKPDCAAGFILNNFNPNDSKTVTFDNSAFALTQGIDFATDYIDYDTFTFIPIAGQELTNPTTLTITNKGVATFNPTTQIITYTKITATVGNIPIKWKVKNECDIFSQEFTLNINSVLSVAPTVNNITKTLFFGEALSTIVTDTNNVTVTRFETTTFPNVGNISISNTGVITYNPISYSATNQVLTLRPVNQYGKVGNSFTITYTILSSGIARPLETCTPLVNFSLFSLLQNGSYSQGVWSGSNITNNTVSLNTPGSYTYVYTVTNPIDNTTKATSVVISYISLSISNLDIIYVDSSTRKAKITTIGFTTEQLNIIARINVRLITNNTSYLISNVAVERIVDSILYANFSLIDETDNNIIRNDYTSIEIIIPEELNDCNSNITRIYTKPIISLQSELITATVNIPNTAIVNRMPINLNSQALTVSVNIPNTLLTTNVVCTSGMDVVFVLDYTQSMSSSISNIKSQITAIKNTIISESNNNYRLGLVLFDETRSTQTTYTSSTAYTSLPSAQKIVEQGTSCNTEDIAPQRYQYFTAMEVMSNNNGDSFTTQLNKIDSVDMNLGSGIGEPEPSDIALYHVAKVTNPITGSFRNNVARLVILITDNLPSGNDDCNSSADLDYINNTLTPLFVSNNLKLLLLSTVQQPQLIKLVSATGGLYENSFTANTIISTIENICVGN